MKKMMVLCALMLSAAAGYAQESRQDVSLSGTAVFAPSIYGPTAVQFNSTKTAGLLASYRYLLTPHSALEVNYSYAQNTNKYRTSNQQNVGVHTLQQEFSAAYVYSRNYHNYNPFVEVGTGAMIFSPVRDSGLTVLDVKRNTNIGALFGAGVAYEISPSFDIRAEYRGFFVKAPSFNDTYKTNRYYVVSTPSIGVAYHF